MMQDLSKSVEAKFCTKEVYRAETVYYRYRKREEEEEEEEEVVCVCSSSSICAEK
jgi:hypothetical protein